MIKGLAQWITIFRPQDSQCKGGTSPYITKNQRRDEEVKEKINTIRTDSGTVYKTHNMKEWIDRENIEILPFEPYTSQHNG